ncbi:MAG: hypothetical protein ABJA86_07515 [Nocardioidaceae bacterium]
MRQQMVTGYLLVVCAEQVCYHSGILRVEHYAASPRSRRKVARRR